MSTLDNAETLARIAQTLRVDIGPAISDEYPKTQAFMASVVLQKLSRQLALASEHADAARGDMAALLKSLREEASAQPLPASAMSAIDVLATKQDKHSLCALIEVLYAERKILGEAHFDSVLGLVRRALRADLDRQMMYSA